VGVNKENTKNQIPTKRDVEYEEKKISIQGGVVTVFFPKVATAPDTMARVRDTLITSYVSDTISNEMLKK